MTQKPPPITSHHFTAGLIQRVLIGTAIGLAVISLFVFAESHPKPEWGRWWRVRPLLVTPLVGALCGLCYHILHQMLRKYRWGKILTLILGILGYIIGIWLGIVLGLDGTLWD